MRYPSRYPRTIARPEWNAQQYERIITAVHRAQQAALELDAIMARLDARERAAS